VKYIWREDGKYSGSPFIGKIPIDWSTKPLVSVSKILSGFPFSANDFSDDGVPVIRMSDFAENNVCIDGAMKVNPNIIPEQALAKAGDIILGLSGSVENFSEIKESILPVAINQRIAIIRDSIINKRFLFWILQSRIFREQISYGLPATTIQNISNSQLKKVKLSIPNQPSEQEKVAGFLDREIAKIDELIHKQEKLIEFLQEKKHISILEVMFKGLNQSAKQKKSSEIFWADEIPEHWAEHRVKFIFEIKKRIAGKLGYDVLSITQQGIKVKDIESNEGQLSMDYSKYQIVEPGDFAMNHMDLLTGYVDISTQLGVTSPDYRVFSIRDASKYFSGFYLLLLQLGYKSKLFFPFGQGAAQVGRWRLPTDAFNNFLFPVPPIHEQIEIFNSINIKNNKIDKLIERASLSIDFLKEHRASLISAAVTGKIDVRELA